MASHWVPTRGSIPQEQTCQRPGRRGCQWLPPHGHAPRPSLPSHMPHHERTQTGKEVSCLPLAAS